jgi:hypothetical protein
MSSASNGTFAFEFVEAALETEPPVCASESDIGRKWILPREDTPKNDKFKVRQPAAVKTHPVSETAIFQTQDYYPNQGINGVTAAIGNPLNVPPPAPGGGQQGPSVQDLESQTDTQYGDYKWKFDMPLGRGTAGTEAPAISVFQNPNDQRLLAKIPEGQNKFKRIFLGKDLIKALMFLKQRYNAGMFEYLQHMDDVAPWIN